jgi:hypothetical protein
VGVLSLNNQHETPEEKRERLRQSELKNNPTGSLHDALNRGSNGNLTDLSGGMGWKGMGVLIVVLIVGYVLYKLLF